ncbi:MAG: (2Fe-2S)-binding protein [Deltaproteobacteria bacterium]|nr:(2Fe-2S)-binding protein [Deltaproteobacteria bacterium]MCK5011479.1 (2Fe-2S)-binding protein [Deltaproteobacteria bacterium]
MKRILSLNVNGNNYEVAINPWQTLLDVLRDELRLIGTKKGCGIGTCGVCTVIIDGKAILSCLTLAVECEGRSITTIEGISSAESLHPIQTSFIENGAIQCGFCTPGIIMTSKALLDENPKPSDDEIKEALAGTFCRCTGHIKTMEAVKKVSQPVEKGKNNAQEK